MKKLPATLVLTATILAAHADAEDSGAALTGIVLMDAATNYCNAQFKTVEDSERFGGPARDRAYASEDGKRAWKTFEEAHAEDPQATCDLLLKTYSKYLQLNPTR